MAGNEDKLASPSIEVEPDRGLADEPISIRLSGFEPHQKITVRAETSDDMGRPWTSYAVFTADSSGTVDLADARPSSGTYKDADAAGLLWSMRPGRKGRATGAFSVSKLEPQAIRLSANCGGKRVALEEIERVYMLPGVTRQPVRENGLTGTFFAPAAQGPRPGIIVLHGTDGRIKEDMAAILASRGFAVLAVLYFGGEGQPDEFIGIPLEYFGKAIAWLQAREEVAENGLGVIGRSRGGELALLVGAFYEQVKVVVSSSGGAVIFEGLNKDPRTKGTQSPYTFRGESLPYLKRVDSGAFVAKAIWSGITGRPFSTLSTYEAALEDGEDLERATIEVEHIDGPILLVSGARDAVWPSERLSQIAMDRLAEHDYHHPVQHLKYEKAGHGVGLPYRPTTVNQTVVFSGAALAFGGDPMDNAHAAADSWPKVVSFLREHLGAD